MTALQPSGQHWQLPSREHAVLENLSARRAALMAKEQFGAKVFGLDQDANPEAIESTSRGLRRKRIGSQVASSPSEPELSCLERPVHDGSG